MRFRGGRATFVRPMCRKVARQLISPGGISLRDPPHFFADHANFQNSIFLDI